MNMCHYSFPTNPGRSVAILLQYTSSGVQSSNAIRYTLVVQRAKKVVSNSLGLVDFALGLVIFVLNLPNRQVLFFLRKSKLQKDCNQSR